MFQSLVIGTVSHKVGTFNVLAEQLFRNTPLSTKWSLTAQDFQKMLKLNPHLKVDLFATNINKKLSVFVLLCPDRTAVAVNVPMVSWERWDHPYIYPPTPLILKVTCKIAPTTYVSAVHLTPKMPMRPWYMALQLQEVPSALLLALLEFQLHQVVVKKIVTFLPWLLSGQHINQNSLAVNKNSSSDNFYVSLPWVNMRLNGISFAIF